MADYLVTDAELTSVADAIREKGGTSSQLEWPDEYIEAIGDIQTGGGGSSDDPLSDPIRFFDYDGTLVASYSSVPSTLPSNPSHSGLVAQGWNYTLAQIQTQFAATGTCDVGQMYVTESGDTEIDVSMLDGRLNPYMNLAPNGTVAIDWGDGSSTDTLTGTSLTTRQGIQHSYAAAGDYTITVHVVSGSVALYGTSAYTLLYKDSTGNNNRVYSNCVRAVRIGISTSIGSYAFSYCYSLTSVTIPSGVTKIGSYAFRECYSLSSVTIPSGVTYIDSYVFHYCYSLTSVTIPSGVTSIGSFAFSYCYSLSLVTIPSGVTQISNDAFSYCYSLSSITIPNSVINIYGSAFSHCYSLSSITIPSGVTKINNSLFSDCYSLSSVTIPSSVTSIGSGVFYYCYSLTSITIPSSVTSIGGNAFRDCRNLSSITIPSSVTRIDDSVFYNCYSLSSITIPSSVTQISGTIFSYCYSLSSITIPSSVTKIGSYAFQYCYGLGAIHFLSTTPPTVSASNAWSNVPTDCKIYVPAGSLSAYTSASNYPSSSTYTYVEE